MTQASDLAELGARGGVIALRARRQLLETNAKAPVDSDEASTLVAPRTLDDDDRIAERVKALVGKKGFLRGDHAEIADRIFDALEADSGARPVSDRGELWHYVRREGLWRVVDLNRVGRLVSLLAGTPIQNGSDGALKGSKANRDGVFAYLQGKPSDSLGFFDSAPPGVSVDNGFLTVDNGEVALAERSHEHRSRARLSVRFDPRATSPRWTRALTEWLEEDPDSREFLQEFVGACLFGEAPRYSGAALLTGEGANGKSVFVEVVSSLFPDGTVTAIPPHDFGSERMGAGLDRSLLNAVSELPERALLSSEGFKAAVSGERMTRRRAYGVEFTFKPRAGHLIAANRLPPVADTSDGFWRRWTVIPFKRQFSKAEQDPRLVETILRDEREGVLAWAVEGARRLSRNKRYTVPVAHVEALDAWRSDSNPVALWLDDRCEVGSAWTQASTLFHDFDRWAHDNGFGRMSNRKFGDRLKELLRRGVGAEGVGWKKGSMVFYRAAIRIL